MKKIFYIPLSFLLFGLQNIHAQETNFTATYEDYQKNVEQYCESPNRPWAKKNAIVPIPQYPQLDTEKVNQAMEKARNNTKISEAERERLLRDLNQDTIARFDGLKVVEVARVQYRTAMNNVFGCSVVDGRLQILGTVKQMIESKTQGRNSEINKKLDAEKKRLERQRDKLQCNTSKNKTIPTSRELTNSATRQYCHYRYWLMYVDENFRENKYKLDSLESTVGSSDGNPTKAKNEIHPRTIDEWRKSYVKQSNSIEREIARADQTLPRAIRSFRDMQHSYPIHLMLIIIYDDFIRVRNNLSVYMNSSSQLYQKAYNAQDKNQR